MEESDGTVDEWGQPEAGETSLAEMDAMVTELRRRRTAYDEAKAVSTKLHDELEEQEKLVLDTLRANGREKYSVQGMGTVYIISKEVYRTPKTLDDKRKLFQYIQEKYGVEACTNMLSINSQTLNSWANKEAEAGVMSIPGLEAPTMMESIGMRKK